MTWPTVKMALALAAVLALLSLTVRVFKRWEGVRGICGQEGGIRVLTSRPIAPQKYVTLVEIGGEVLALGVTPQQITFLTKVESREGIQKSPGGPALRPEVFSWLKSFSPFPKPGSGRAAEMRDAR